MIDVANRLGCLISRADPEGLQETDMSHQYGLQARMSAAILGVIIILWGVLSLNSQEIDKRAVALHHRMLVFDAHAHDVVLAPGAKENPGAQASLLSLRRVRQGFIFLRENQGCRKVV